MVERRFSAPGRVNLIGEHTDYTGGLVLPAAIDRGVTLLAELGGDRIVLTSDTAEGRVDLPADGSEAPADGWGRYVAAVAMELSLLGRAPVGLRGHLTSDLPTGSGLSSSAALEVVLGTALCHAADLVLEPLELAAAMQRAELRGVGVPCGIMDQAASVLGREGHAVLLDCDSLEVRHVPLPPDLAILVLDSGVRRRLGESGYAQRRAELEEALKVLDGRLPKDVAPDEADAAAERAGLEPVLRRRLRHVVTENVRVLEVERALARAGGPDIDRLASLFAASHASLRDDFEVSVPEVDRLVELAVEAGAAAARMTGGGFGGAIVALVPHERTDDVADLVLERYRSAHPGLEPTALTARAAAGAGERR